MNVSDIDKIISEVFNSEIQVKRLNKGISLLLYIRILYVKRIKKRRV